MFRYVLITWAVCFLQSELSAQGKEIGLLASAVADNLAKASKKTVAVVDFADLQGNVPELGRFLAEEVSVALSAAGKGLEVVDRAHLKILLQEHKLAASGLIDPATARKLGQIAGVEVLITGTITPFGDTVRVSAKALDTTTARIITASSTDIAKTKAIEELLSRGVGNAGATGREEKESPNNSASPRTAPAPRLMTAEVDQFQFTLTFCKLVGGSVTCRLLVTNKAGDQELWLYTYGEPPRMSRLIDQLGQEYAANGGQIGNVVTGLYGQARNTLANGVPTLLEVAFENIPSALSSIPLLELGCASSRKVFNVQFRGVPLTR